MVVRTERFAGNDRAIVENWLNRMLVALSTAAGALTSALLLIAGSLASDKGVRDALWVLGFAGLTGTAVLLMRTIAQSAPRAARARGTPADRAIACGSGLTDLDRGPVGADLGPGRAQLGGVEPEREDRVRPLASASSTSRSVACLRPSSSIFVMPLSSPPTMAFNAAPIVEPTFRERTVSPNASPSTSSTT